jgi:hypothetical protein
MNTFSGIFYGELLTSQVAQTDQVAHVKLFSWTFESPNGKWLSLLLLGKVGSPRKHN